MRGKREERKTRLSDSDSHHKQNYRCVSVCVVAWVGGLDVAVDFHPRA